MESDIARGEQVPKEHRPVSEHEVEEMRVPKFYRLPRPTPMSLFHELTLPFKGLHAF